MNTIKTNSKSENIKTLILRFIIIICLIGLASAQAQNDSLSSPTAIRLNGPRIGFTYVGPGKVAETLEEKNVSPYITQFGWQFENRFFTLDNGTSGLIEYVLLVGGLDQNMFLPSATVLIGLRTRSGFEFGAGPNISVAGAGFAFAAGYTLKSENIFFPINLAVVPSPNSTRVSLIFGFNAKTKYRPRKYKPNSEDTEVYKGVENHKLVY
jgi:hypothetical protein